MKFIKFTGFILALNLLIGGTTGKLAGTVTNAQTGEVLIGCSVMLIDTDMGSATDSKGDFFILNIPPGYYDVRAMMIGYEMITKTDVLISIDKTTPLNFKLNIEALQGDAITVSGQAKVIQFDVTNSEARVTSKELEVMPVTDVSDVIKLQGGVTQDADGGIHIRGGRKSEVVYMVDGVSMSDVFNGDLSVSIENSNIQELQVISGTFNAEYGKAMSGIINMVTKDGGNRFDGGFKIWGGDHISYDDIYTDLDSYSIGNDLNVEANFSGPILKDKISFYSSGRYFRSEGWLSGLNTFTMYGDTIFNDLNGNKYRDGAEDFFDEQNQRWVINGEFLDDGNGQYDLGEPFVDCGQDRLCPGDPGYVEPDEGENDGIRQIGESFTDLFGNSVWDPGELFVNDSTIVTPEWDEGEIFRDEGNGIWDEGDPYEDVNGNDQYDRGEPFTDIIGQNGQWDDAESLQKPYYRSMNWLEKWSSQNKITFKISPKTKLKFNVLISKQEKQDYDHGRQMTQAGRKTDYDMGNFFGLNLSHSFSSRSFFEFNISHYTKKYESFLFEDHHDPRYVTPDSLFWAHEQEIIPNWVIDQYGAAYAHYEPDYSYGRWGVDTNHYWRQTITDQLKFDMTSQINKYNLIKFGIDFQKHILEEEDVTAVDMSNDQIFIPKIPELMDQNDFFDEINDFLVVYNPVLELENEVAIQDYQKFTGDVPSFIQNVHYVNLLIDKPDKNDYNLNDRDDLQSYIDEMLMYFGGKMAIYGNYYRNEPIEFSAYIQDKIEYGDMIINVGLRYDYFDPNSYMPVNIHDPFFYNPQNPRLDSLLYDGRYNDLLHINWGDTSHYVVSIDGQDTTYYTYADFGDYPNKEELKTKTGWWRKTKTNSQFSPRLGVAYPISDKGVIHFSYGYFFQIPQFERLYTNPGYYITETATYSGIFGNPELKPQKTVSYELGLQQEIAQNIKMEITGYSRDVRDWVATSIPFDLGISGSQYYTYANKDYSNVRGVIFSLDKLFSNYFSWHIDYTFQIAEGSHSDPGEEYGAVEDNNEPTRFIVPLDWDQRHTFGNANIYFGTGNWGANLMMQFGSGYPYTPSFGTQATMGQNISTNLPTNSRRKQLTFNFDLKLYKNIKVNGIANGKIYCNIYNLFDRRNEVSIYTDTGRANKTLEEKRALSIESAGPQPLRPNTIEEHFIHPEWYSSPRNIQIGLELTW